MGERDNVLLRVAAVHPQSMELHHFTGVVLIDAVELAVLARRIGRRILPIVEVEEHRRMVRGRTQQIAETAHRMRPDCFLFKGAGPN